MSFSLASIQLFRSLLSLSWVLQTHARPYDSVLTATAACLVAIKSSAMVSIPFLFAFTPCFSVSTVYVLCLAPTCIVLSAYLAPTSVLNASIHWSHSFPFMLNFLLLSSLYIPIKWETHYGLSLTLLLSRLLPHTSPCFPFAFLSNFFFFFFVHSSLAFLPLVLLALFASHFIAVSSRFSMSESAFFFSPFSDDWRLFLRYSASLSSSLALMWRSSLMHGCPPLLRFHRLPSWTVP